MLEATETCKEKEPACDGGKFSPFPSARFSELPPRYNTLTINRHDGPEDGTLENRCLTGGLPNFENRLGNYRRIVQTPGGVSIFYDVGQGQGWQRNVVMSGSAHLPGSIRQWYGDSRGSWDGETLVIDVANFSPKTDFEGSRENLHLLERWTRTGADTLEYEVTIDDPTVWIRPWTVREELKRQSDEQNRFYSEPRCVEGNLSLPAIFHGRRIEELEFARGRGPDPRTRDNVKPGFLLQDDPLMKR